MGTTMFANLVTFKRGDEEVAVVVVGQRIPKDQLALLARAAVHEVRPELETAPTKSQKLGFVGAVEHPPSATQRRLEKARKNKGGRQRRLF